MDTCKVYCFVKVDFLLGKVVGGEESTKHSDCRLKQVDVLDHDYNDYCDYDHDGLNYDHDGCDDDHDICIHVERSLTAL